MAKKARTYIDSIIVAAVISMISTQDLARIYLINQKQTANECYKGLNSLAKNEE